MMNYSGKHSKLFVYPITCHKWNLETLLSSLIGWQRVTCSKIIHHSFFACWSVGQTIQPYLSSLVNGKDWSQARGQKTGQLCIVYFQKHIHLPQDPYLRSTVCGQVMQKANTHCCQGKKVPTRKETADVTASSPSSCQENCDRLENEADTGSPAQVASTENNAQEIYPWMKEFRSKGTRENRCRWFCPKNVREERKWEGSEF